MAIEGGLGALRVGAVWRFDPETVAARLTGDPDQAKNVADKIRAAADQDGPETGDREKGERI